MRSPLQAAAIAAAAALAVSAALATQPVEPMAPGGEQQIEVLRPGVAQSVDAVAPQPEQQVGVPEPVSPGKRAASTAGKVVLGVAAAGVAIGAAILSLLFL